MKEWILPATVGSLVLLALIGASILIPPSPMSVGVPTASVMFSTPSSSYSSSYPSATPDTPIPTVVVQQGGIVPITCNDPLSPEERLALQCDIPPTAAPQNTQNVQVAAPAPAPVQINDLVPIPPTADTVVLLGCKRGDHGVECGRP